MSSSGPETLHKRRILCLHGGGVSAEIFRLQARGLIQALSPYFRLVFADGPFPSEMHPDLIPVYSSMGPCYQWAGWLPQQVAASGLDDDLAVKKIQESLQRAMASDPGTGEWVGLLGFSQGAKLAFSILLEDQQRRQEPSKPPYQNMNRNSFLGVNWNFGILLAGRGPPYALSHRTLARPHYDGPGKPTTTAATLSVKSMTAALQWNPPGRESVLATPTVHVHGLRDDGLPFHRLLLNHYVDPASAQLVEWDGNHRVPIRTVDVDAVTRAIMRVVKVENPQIPQCCH
ncbi:hypothetical protein FQN55_000556 [Onygenales sp. PD_40]|nr:hypothetical protein FQN55_000556 [Onygenales sp. PD_40]KAK2786556.1 hypothetical protein FQN53_006490 [Emmonsiellopsis sp. PD_33]